MLKKLKLNEQTENVGDKLGSKIIDTMIRLNLTLTGIRGDFKGSKEHLSHVFMGLWEQDTFIARRWVLSINQLGPHKKQEVTNNGMECRSSLFCSLKDTSYA